MLLVPEQTIERFRRRKLFCLLGDTTHAWLVAPAEGMTAGLVNEILALTGGNLLVALSRGRAREFGLLEGRRDDVGPGINPHLKGLGSVEASIGITTGISASDRARTIEALGARVPDRAAIARPGHIFPVLAEDTECYAVEPLAVKLVKQAGYPDAAVVVRMLREDGMPFTVQELEGFVKKHDIEMKRAHDMNKGLIDCTDSSGGL